MMKKDVIRYCLLVGIVLVSATAFAQKEKKKKDEDGFFGMVTEIDMDVDKEIFPGHNGMFYYSEDNRDVFMIAFIAPQDYETAKKHQLDAQNGKHSIVIEEEELRVRDGVNYVYQKGTLTKENVVMTTYSYLVEYTKEQTLLLMGWSKPNDPEHIKAFETAVFSFIERNCKK